MWLLKLCIEINVQLRWKRSYEFVLVLHFGKKKNIVYDKIGMAKLETRVLFYLQASYNIDNSQVDFFYAALQVNFTSKQTKQSCPLEVVLHLEAASAEGSAIMSTEQNCSDS